MTTKENQQLFVSTSADNGNQYLNLNLKQCPDISAVHSNNKSFNDTHFDLTIYDNNEEKTKSQSWNKQSSTCTEKPYFTTFYDNTEEEKVKKRWKKKGTFSNANKNSTLSLHISVYENSNKVVSDSLNIKIKNEKLRFIKKLEHTKQSFISSSFLNSFEFPRQQDDKILEEPEVSQFKASQKLLNQNETSKNDQQSKQQNHRQLKGTNNEVYIRIDQPLTLAEDYDQLTCSPELIKLLKEDSFSPRPLEKLLLPLGFEGKDLQVQAKKGSGKTLCLSTLAANCAYKYKDNDFVTIILAPEAKDVYKIERYVSSLIDERIVIFGGDVTKDSQGMMENFRYPIVIAVPKELHPFIHSQQVSLKNVKLFIVAKCDKFSNDTLQNHIICIANSLNAEKPQIALFSNSNAGNIGNFFGQIMSDPILIQLGIEESADLDGEKIFVEVEKVSAESVVGDSEVEKKVVEEDGIERDRNKVVGDDKNTEYESVAAINGDKNVSVEGAKANSEIVGNNVEENSADGQVAKKIVENWSPDLFAADTVNDKELRAVATNQNSEGGEKKIENFQLLNDKITKNDSTDIVVDSKIAKQDSEDKKMKVVEQAVIGAKDIDSQASVKNSQATNDSKVFDFVLFQLNKDPASIVNEILAEVSFKQVMIFVKNDFHMCQTIYETLRASLYKCKLVTNEMRSDEIDEVIEAFQNKRFAILISKDLPMYDDIEELVDLTINIGAPDDKDDYEANNNQVQGAAITIFTSLEELQNFVHNLSFAEIDFRGLQLDENLSDNLTTDNSFFKKSLKLADFYNKIVKNQKAESVDEIVQSSVNNTADQIDKDDSPPLEPNTCPPAVVNVEKVLQLCPDLEPLHKSRQQQQPSSSSFIQTEQQQQKSSTSSSKNHQKGEIPQQRKNQTAGVNRTYPQIKLLSQLQKNPPSSTNKNIFKK